MLIGQYENYREFLQDELARRAQNNVQYSLRAFARDLNIAPQILSQVMNGSKNISNEKAIEIAKKLNLSQAELSYFYDLVEFSQTKSTNLREVIKYRLSRYDENKTYRVLQEDVFKIISDWYHYAILELSLTKNFKKDPRWISKRLGINPLEARQAVERLLKLELLEEVGDTIKKTEINIASSQDIPSAAVRKLAKQILDKAADALENQKIEDRDFGSMTMAIDPAKIPAAKKLIRKFRRELAETLETGSRTEVYVLSTELFRLTKNES